VRVEEKRILCTDENKTQRAIIAARCHYLSASTDLIALFCCQLVSRLFLDVQTNEEVLAVDGLILTRMKTPNRISNSQ